MFTLEWFLILSSHLSMRLGCLEIGMNINFFMSFISFISQYVVFNVQSFIMKSFDFDWRRRDSNSWPPACKAGALPTELRPQMFIFYFMMGLNGLEPSTSRLSGVRSNQLSYKPLGIRQPPAFPYRLQYSIIGRSGLNHRVRDENGCVPWAHRHRKILST